LYVVVVVQCGPCLSHSTPCGRCSQPYLGKSTRAVIASSSYQTILRYWSSILNDWTMSMIMNVIFD